jgi:hypothetical protein
MTVTASRPGGPWNNFGPALRRVGWGQAPLNPGPPVWLSALADAPRRAYDAPDARLPSVTDDHRERRVRAILTDPQLWAPLVVLIAGIAVLVWVHG